MPRTSSGLIMYSGSVSEEANFEGEPNPDKVSEPELVVDEVCAARDEHAADRSRQATTRLFPWSFLRGSHFMPADIIISVLLVILAQEIWSAFASSRAQTLRCK